MLVTSSSGSKSDIISSCNTKSNSNSMGRSDSSNFNCHKLVKEVAGDSTQNSYYTQVRNLVYKYM